MAGERRIVTMLFCDIKGSTAMAGHLDPEEWADVMKGTVEHLVTPVYRYEGTVAQLLGDGMASWPSSGRRSRTKTTRSARCSPVWT